MKCSHKIVIYLKKKPICSRYLNCDPFYKNATGEYFIVRNGNIWGGTSLQILSWLVHSFYLFISHTLAHGRNCEPFSIPYFTRCHLKQKISRYIRCQKKKK